MRERMTADEYNKLPVKRGNRTSPHTALLGAITGYLALKGWSVFAWPASAFGRNGMPDKIAIREGRHLWIEAKTGKAVLSEDQEARKAELEAAGATVLVVRSLEELVEELET